MIQVFITQKRPRVDFANILLEAFTREDPKSAKNTVNLSVFFALLYQGIISFYFYALD